EPVGPALDGDRLDAGRGDDLRRINRVRVGVRVRVWIRIRVRAGARARAGLVPPAEERPRVARVRYRGHPGDGQGEETHQLPHDGLRKGNSGRLAWSGTVLADDGVDRTSPALAHGPADVRGVRANGARCRAAELRLGRLLRARRGHFFQVFRRGAVDEAA